MCAAMTRWVSYNVASSGTAGTGNNECKGTRGYSLATASVGDSFTVGSTTNRLHLNIGGVADYITLYSGSNLDARFVARDITEKIRAKQKGTEDWDKAICVWENSNAYNNHFALYTGDMGSSAQVTVVTGTNSAHTTLGWASKSEAGGTTGTYTFSGDASISGTYYGLFSDVYKVVITSDADATRGIGTAAKGGSNSYLGTITTGGLFNYTSDIEYTININATNGTVMGAGTGNVPTMSWTSTGSVDNSSVSTELLYPNHWYNVGSNGLMVKFSDAVFNTVSPAWTIQCYKPDYAQGSNATAPVGTAQYNYSSIRGDNGSSVITTISGAYTQLGSKGLSIKFDPDNGADYLGAGDEFTVICAGVQPDGYNISSVNYGNVTVSTESPVKCVMFEVESGAVMVSTVKFGLQSHGTFSHHVTGNGDTLFRFGTCGPANMAGTVPTNGIEWYPNIVAADIDNDVPPEYLYSTDDNLLVVATADDSKAVGSLGLCSDPIWFNIRLGASETGANSALNYRLYFDYM